MTYMGVSRWDVTEPGPEDRKRAAEAVRQGAGEDEQLVLFMLGLEDEQ